ncbi:hypothetical protein RIF29_18084 [Crotalaria pallida]|uniref:Uncharacterized protein n=1 Tax=Crotalaria pallida TaxID=3830 RepID=A0AAN9FJA3_CROPI
MDLQPETKPGIPPPPGFGTSPPKPNLNDMTVSNLVSILRTAFRFDEFDTVEKVLVDKDAKLKADIASLQLKFESERFNKIQAEEDLNKREEQFQKGKRAQELYEKLLKEVKENELVHMETIKELKEKNIGLLDENCKLKELKTKWADERVELEARKKSWEDDKIALEALRSRNNELEEALKNDKCVIDELRALNTRLLDEKQGLVALVESKERKFLELNEKVTKIENDVKLLKNVDDDSKCGKWKEPKGEPEELEEFNEMDVGGCNGGSSIPFRRKGDTHKVNKDAPGASEKPKAGFPLLSFVKHGIVPFVSLFMYSSLLDLEGPGCGTGRSPLVHKNIIVLSDNDDDDDDNDDQAHRRQQKRSSVERLTRKMSVSDISSPSSDSSFEWNKRRKRG